MNAQGGAQTLQGEAVMAPRVTLGGDRLPNGLRVALVFAESGDRVFYALCDRHQWLSVGGGRSEAEGATCPGCLAAIEAMHRRRAFMGHHGSVVLAGLFESQDRS